MEHLQRKEEIDRIWSYTNFIEKIYHGSPSGCDAAVSIHGGIIFYKKGIPPKMMELKKLDKIDIDKLEMLVVNTNVKKDTKKLVEAVAQFKKYNKSDFDECMGTLGNVTEELVELLQEQNLDKFAFLDYISMLQQYLQEIQVSSSEIDDIVSTMMSYEVHGKITGAGGGGCVIGFAKDPKSLFEGDKETCSLVKELESKGYTVIHGIKTGWEGFKIEMDPIN